MTPLVSVLIPCYNAQRFISETIESVLSQTWGNLEIIVVDDGSTDGSARELERFSDNRVRVVRQTNRGQTAALNTALAHANGDFIQYLDADDLISPHKIELQMHRLAERTDCVASAEWGRFYNDPKETRFVKEPVWQDLDPLDWLATARANGQDMMFPALWLLPRAIVQRTGPWREDLSLNNDAEYFTRALLNAKRVLFCEGAQCHYRSGIIGSLSGQKTAKAWTSQYAVLDLCESYVRAREDSERVRRGFALSWQHLAHACYPYDSGMAERALQRARTLHSVEIRPDGGTAFHLVTQLFGWRIARKIQAMRK